MELVSEVNQLVGKNLIIFIQGIVFGLEALDLALVQMDRRLVVMLHLMF